MRRSKETVQRQLSEFKFTLQKQNKTKQRQKQPKQQQNKQTKNMI